MAYATNLGFPRIGPDRELKKAVENYWFGKIPESELLDACKRLRQSAWALQKEMGLHHIPSNDFSLYDHVLDTACMVDAVPTRYGKFDGLKTYFAMARGVQEKDAGGKSTPAMEMTKWFDTNYHYIVPEFEKGQRFQLSFTKPIDEFIEAKKLGVHTRPVLLGPVSFLLLGKVKDPGFDRFTLLDSLLPVYKEVLGRLIAAKADWVQIDEPCLAMDIDDAARAAFARSYAVFQELQPALKICLTTYFSGLRENLATALALPVAALHVDLVRAPEQIDEVLRGIPQSMRLSLGVVDGRNIWRNDFERSLAMIQKAVKALGTERIFIGPSCSMLHSPVDLDLEEEMDPEIRQWLAFAKQKVEEIVILANDSGGAVASALEANLKVTQSRKTSKKIHNPEIKKRAAALTDVMLKRENIFSKRKPAQDASLHLPKFPTTTIGSFPQTREIRVARADFKKGAMDEARYESFMKKEIEEAIRIQEEIGLDVLVHGEPERNDMVEYFGEQLDGFVFTQFGWVQSYGSRCVKPPIIYGDVARPKPMTVKWSQYAQSLTEKPVKGMLTGPVTILQWSFVRNDQPRKDTAFQIALALRDEVADLEKAGIHIIQIDEPAFREGLPLRRSDWKDYIRWAVDAFKLSSSGVKDETQIHTHMCYCEFNDVIDSIGAMDADVISMETSRSQAELLGAFRGGYKYPNDIGPGVYDIHSPRIPSAQEMEGLLEKALEVLSPDQLWVNPDCGLKTRRWEEVKPSLKGMVEAAKHMRSAVVAR